MGQFWIICIPHCSGLRNNTKSSVTITPDRTNRNWAPPKYGHTSKGVRIQYDDGGIYGNPKTCVSAAFGPAQCLEQPSYSLTTQGTLFRFPTEEIFCSQKSPGGFRDPSTPYLMGTRRKFPGGKAVEACG